MIAQRVKAIPRAADERVMAQDAGPHSVERTTEELLALLIENTHDQHDHPAGARGRYRHGNRGPRLQRLHRSLARPTAGDELRRIGEQLTAPMARVVLVVLDVEIDLRVRIHVAELGHDGLRRPCLVAIMTPASRGEPPASVTPSHIQHRDDTPNGCVRTGHRLSPGSAGLPVPAGSRMSRLNSSSLAGAQRSSSRPVHPDDWMNVFGSRCMRLVSPVQGFV